MTEPAERDEQPELPEFLVVLGLAQPVTVDDVKQAYLDKAKTAHPDRGGDPAGFIRLQEAYEKATEYAKFKAGRMKWLSGWVEQYADQQALVDRIKALGGTIENESVDWLAQTIGQDFATVLDRITGIRLAGPRINDAVVATLAAERRSLGNLHRLALVQTTITPEGLAPLYELKSLRELDLSGTQVTPTAVEELLAFLPDLKKISLQDSGLTWPGRLKLRFAHRDLDITF
jgi:hypothetical protein